MLQIRASQQALFDALAFEAYLDSLTEMLRGLSCPTAGLRLVLDRQSVSAVRELARVLVARANALGFECEGDVTPFCLLAVSDDASFRQSGIYDYVSEFLTATDLPAEDRMDAVYAVLPEPIRSDVFGNSLSKS